MSNVYEIVNNRIIELLERGTIPWRRMWSAGSGMPRNLVSKKEYRGINVFLLSAMPYSSPYWLTYRQAQERGGHVRPGEKSTIVTFWKLMDRNPSEEETVTGKTPLLRYYNVFNLEQCEGIACPEPEGTVNEFTPIEKAEQIIKDMPKPPTIIYGGNRAFYRPSEDRVQMPHEYTFERSEDFYAVLFHELSHSTGAVNRLARKEVMERNAFGSDDYSAEELVAEFAASFLCAVVGISNETIEMSAAYIDGWLSVLKRDKKLLITAAAQAQRAADFILNRRFGTEDGETA